MKKASDEDVFHWFFYFPTEEDAAKHAKKIRLRTYSTVRHQKGWAIAVTPLSFVGKQTRMKGNLVWGADYPGVVPEVLEQGRQVVRGIMVFPSPTGKKR